MESESVKDIKSRLENAGEEELLRLIETYSADERSGVKKLIEGCLKKEKAMLRETERLTHLSVFERACRAEGYRLIAGIDEAGRGPLAGPVVAAAVILPEGLLINGVNDSKKLTAKKREELYDIITEKAVSFGVGMASPMEIDKINILRATYAAMTEAVAALSPQPEMLLVDAVNIPALSIPQRGIIKGDAKSISIAVASIIAKVTRDRLMDGFAGIYPEYGFEKHKGYGSAEHIAAIKKYGPSPIHRRSFIKNFTGEGR